MPIIPLPDYYWRPTSSVQPFTYKDGMSYLQILERLRGYITKTLVPWLENEISQFEGDVETSIAALTAYVNSAVESIINDSIQVQDPVVATLVNNAASATRVALDAIYASDADISTINNSINEVNGILNGRLSTISLEGQFVTWRLWDGSAYPARKSGINIFIGPVNPGLVMGVNDVWVNPDVTTLASVVAAMNDTSSELHKATVRATDKKEMRIAPQLTNPQGVISFGTSPNVVFAWEMVKGGNNAVRFMGIIPEGWNVATIRAKWIANVAGGAARIGISNTVVDETGIISQGSTTANRTNGGAMMVNTIEYTNRPVKAGAYINGTVNRLSDDANDTIASSVGILSVEIVKVS